MLSTRASALHSMSKDCIRRQLIVVPARALEEFEGREQSIVELQYTSSSKVLAGGPIMAFRLQLNLNPRMRTMRWIFPNCRPSSARMMARLLKALDDAMHTASNDP